MNQPKQPHNQQQLSINLYIPLTSIYQRQQVDDDVVSSSFWEANLQGSKVVGGTWASARVKPRVAARVVISGGASGSAPAAWQREVELRRYLGSRVFYASHDGSMGRFCMFTYPQASSHILSWWSGCLKSLPQQSIWVPLPFSEGDWIPRVYEWLMFIR